MEEFKRVKKEQTYELTTGFMSSKELAFRLQMQQFLKYEGMFMVKIEKKVKPEPLRLSFARTVGIGHGVYYLYNGKDKYTISMSSSSMDFDGYRPEEKFNLRNAEFLEVTAPKTTEEEDILTGNIRRLADFEECFDTQDIDEAGDQLIERVNKGFETIRDSEFANMVKTGKVDVERLKQFQALKVEAVKLMNGLFAEYAPKKETTEN